MNIFFGFFIGSMRNFKSFGKVFKCKKGLLELSVCLSKSFSLYFELQKTINNFDMSLNILFLSVNISYD